MAMNLSLQGAAQEQGAQDPQVDVSDGRWVDFPPLGGKQAIALGYDLPLAMGIGPIDSTVTFNLPGIGGNPGQSIPVTLPSSPDAPLYGGGISINGGTDTCFASADGVYQITDFDQFDERIEVTLVSARIGWRGKLAEDTRIRVWGGGTYWDTARTVKGSTPVGAGVLSYEVDQVPVTEWSFLLGTNVEVYKHFSLVMEGQYYRDIAVILVGGTFRF